MTEPDALTAQSLVFDCLTPQLFETRSGSDFWGSRLRMEKGAFWQVVGPSGSGKTSLFGFLSGTGFSYRGSISAEGLFEGRPLACLNEAEWSVLRRAHLSFVFQDLRLISGLSIRDNLLLKADVSVRSQSSVNVDFHELILNLATALEIDLLLKKRPTVLSRGEQQRAAIIRALLQDFDFLILDEPFSHLDPRLAKIAANLLHQWCIDRNASVLALDLHSNEHFPWNRRVHLSGTTE